MTEDGDAEARQRHRDPLGQAPLERRSGPQQVGRPVDETVNHRAQALQIPLAVQTGGDVGLCARNLTRGQRLRVSMGEN